MNKTHCRFNSVTRIEPVDSIYPTQDDKLHFPKKLNVCSGCLLLFLFFYKVYSYFYWIRNHTIFIWMSMPLSLLPLLIFSKLNDRLTLENYWYFFCVCDYHSPIYAYGLCSDSREVFTDCDSFLHSQRLPSHHQGDKKNLLLHFHINL